MSVRLPNMLDERAEALSDVVEGVLAAWQERPFPEGEASRALRDACRALSLFRDQGLSIEDPLAPLDAVAAAVTKATAVAPAWAQPELETLAEVAVEVTELRRAALDRLDAPVLSHERANAGGPLGLMFPASIGSPAPRFDIEIPSIALIREERSIELELEQMLEQDPDEQPDDDDGVAVDAQPDGRLASAPPPPPVPAAPDAHYEHKTAQLAALARDLMEDIGMLFGLKKPLDSEAWRSPDRFEERLFAQLDALFSLARATHDGEPRLPLVEALYRYATEWAVPDLGRAYALALPLATIEGESSARWLLVALRHAHPRSHPAFVDALALGPNTKLARAISSRLGTTEPAHVLVALLNAARRRRDVSPASIAMLLDHPEPAVVVAAVRALAKVDPTISTPLLSDALTGEGAVAIAAAEALASFGAPSAFVTMRGWLEQDTATVGEDDALDSARSHAALRALACRGERNDEPLVLRAALALSGGLRWLGTFGQPAHAELLLKYTEDPARKHAARRGLSILLGGDFDSDEADFNRDPSLREAVLLDRAERRKYAETARERTRKGAPHRGVSTLLAELTDPMTLGAERHDLAFELQMLVGNVVPFDPEDWIARQTAALELLTASARA